MCECVCVCVCVCACVRVQFQSHYLLLLLLLFQVEDRLVCTHKHSQITETLTNRKKSTVKAYVIPPAPTSFRYLHVHVNNVLCYYTCTLSVTLCTCTCTLSVTLCIRVHVLVVCLILLASFFLPSSLIKTCILIT